MALQAAAGLLISSAGTASAAIAMFDLGDQSNVLQTGWTNVAANGGTEAIPFSTTDVGSGVTFNVLTSSHGVGDVIGRKRTLQPTEEAAVTLDNMFVDFVLRIDTFELSGLTADALYDVDFIMFDANYTNTTTAVTQTVTNITGTSDLLGSVSWIGGVDLASDSDYTLSATDLQADSNGKLTFALASDGNNGNPLLNGIVVVPEPSSTALLGLGGLALMLRRRR